MSKKRKVLISIIAIVMVYACTWFFASDIYERQKNITMEINSNGEKTIYYSYADYPYYESLSSLVNNSELIVYCEVEKKQYDWRSLLIEDEEGGNLIPDQLNEKELITIYNLKIINDYSGEDRKNIQLLQLGGETDYEIYQYDESPILKEGEQYVLFLSKSSKWDNSYWLMNNAQSVYEVNKKDNSISGGDFELSFDLLETISN